MSGERGLRRRVRKRTLRRWVAPGFAVLAVVASLMTVVRRGEEGRGLARALQALEAERQIVADRIVAEQARVDSLTHPARIEEVARPLGLRQAFDAELVQVEAAPR